MAVCFLTGNSKHNMSVLRIFYFFVALNPMCCYGTLLCHKNDNNVFTNDSAVFSYHLAYSDCGRSRSDSETEWPYRKETIMSNSHVDSVIPFCSTILLCQRSPHINNIQIRVLSCTKQEV